MSSVVEQPQTTKKRGGRQTGRALRSPKAPRAASYTTPWATTGIGRAIAQRLAEEGACVITAQRGEDAKFDGIAAYFTDPQAQGRVLDQVIKRAGRLDLLVNNVGVMQ